MAKVNAQKQLKKLKAAPQGRKNKRAIASISEKLSPTTKGKK